MQIKKAFAALTAAALIGCNSMLTPFSFTAPPSILVQAEEQAEVTVGDLTFTKYDDHAEVSKCAKDAAEVVIPAEVDGLPVTSIGEYTFSDCESLTAVTIPDSVTSIGDNAFRSCADLKEITIPNSVTSIEHEAFASCYSLTSITIPDGVTSISAYTFARCYSLSAVTIPDSVTAIGDGAFVCCRSLTAITLPECVASIGQQAFDVECVTAVTVLNPDCEIYDDAKTIKELSTIRGYEGSTAQAYAEKYNRKFESLGAAPEQPTEPETDPTEPPTEAPTEPVTELPTEAPTDPPTDLPTEAPTDPPTDLPTEPVEPADPNEIYKDVLDMFRKNISESWENYDGETDYGVCADPEKTSVSYQWTRYLKTVKASEVGYLFLDLDEDGTQELFIGAYGAGSVTVMEIYTYANGKVRHLASTGERVSFDIGKKEIIKTGSGGAANYGSTYYHIADGALVPYETYEYNENKYPDQPYLHGTDPVRNADGSYSFSWKQITEAEYTAGMDAHPYIPFSFTRFEAAENTLGDLNGDNAVNASDAAKVLIAAASAGGGGDLGLTDTQKTAADVNHDDAVNASDAALILQYAAAVGGGYDKGLTEFLAEKGLIS